MTEFLVEFCVFLMIVCGIAFIGGIIGMLIFTIKDWLDK